MSTPETKTGAQTENEPARQIKSLGLKHFDLVGFAEAGRPATLSQYENWLNNGSHGGRDGGMGYLERHLEKKSNPQLLLPGAKSWIVLVLNYDTQEPLSIELAEQMRRDRQGWIARYARGGDYHQEIGVRHDLLIQDLQSLFPCEKFVGCVDAQAVLERDVAQRAGLGWIGKNTCLINQEIGSFVFLSEILTTLELQPDKPIADHCGTCTRCLDACPTEALVAPRELDATKCISYWTIESKTSPPPELSAKMGVNFFGCDICQDVCPWNQKARRKNTLPRPRPGPHGDGRVNVEEIVALEPAEIKVRYKEMALSRAKPERLKENARRVLRNLDCDRFF